MRVDSRHAKSCGIRATHGRTECAHASTQPHRDSERGAGIASRLASARSGGAVTAAPTVPAYGAKMAAAGSHPQPRVPPRPALSAPLCLSPRPCRAAAISPRSPRRRCGRAARPFASAFAPAPAPRKGMAFGPRRGHAAQRRGSRRAHMCTQRALMADLDRARCWRARGSWRPADGLRDGLSYDAEGLALDRGGAARKKVEIASPSTERAPATSIQRRQL